MTEKEVKIRTKDGHTIYGVLSDQTARPSATLVIFVHGLASNMHEHKYYNAARVFAKEGIATYRFNLYDSGKGGRSITDCTFAVHADDLNRVVAHFRKHHASIFVVGHSLGAVVIMLADTKKVSGVVFWDGTHLESVFPALKKSGTLVWNKSMKAYIARWGCSYLIPKALVENEQLSSKELIQKLAVPVKFISADKGILVQGTKEFYKHANNPKELAWVKGADHNFDRGETAAELHRETLAFVKKYQ